MFKVKVNRMELANKYDNQNVGATMQAVPTQPTSPQIIAEYVRISLTGGCEDWSIYADLPKDLVDDTAQLGDEYEIIFKKIK